MKSITRSDILQSLLVLAIAKSFVFGGTSVDIAICISVSALLGFSLYIDNTKVEDKSQELLDALTKLEAATDSKISHLESKISVVTMNKVKPDGSGQKFGW